MLDQVDMFQRLLPKHHLIKTSQDGLYQKLEEPVMIRGDQIEIKRSTINPHSENNLIQKVKLDKDATSAQVQEVKQES